jgi:hypothetical protein
MKNSKSTIQTKPLVHIFPCFSPTLLLAGMLMAFASCNESKITQAWSNKSNLKAQQDLILVLALVPGSEKPMAEQMEKHLAADLANLGYRALTAAHLYDTMAFCPGNDTVILQKLKDKKVDALLTVALTDKQTVQKFVQGRYIYPPNFMDYVGPKYAVMYEPSHIETNSNYIWETRIYRIQSGEMIYFSRTTSQAPNSVKTMAHEYGRKIMRNLVKRNVVIPLLLPGEE